MKKFITLLLFALPLPVFANLTHSISSSVKLESLSAATSADKIGSSYSISGNGVTTVDSNSAATIGGFGTTSNGIPSISFPSASQHTSGQAFSYSTSYLEGDATSGSSVTVGQVGNFSDLTSTSAGSVGTAAVSLDNHTMTLTGGTGTGVVLTGQFVTDLTVD